MNDEAMWDFAILVGHYSCVVDSSQRRSGRAIHGALSASAATAPDDTARGRRSSGVSAERLKNAPLKSRLER
jgi:hypothetical protein